MIFLINQSFEQFKNNWKKKEIKKARKNIKENKIKFIFFLILEN